MPFEPRCILACQACILERHEKRSTTHILDDALEMITGLKDALSDAIEVQKVYPSPPAWPSPDPPCFGLASGAKKCLFSGNALLSHVTHRSLCPRAWSPCGHLPLTLPSCAAPPWHRGRPRSSRRGVSMACAQTPSNSTSRPRASSLQHLAPTPQASPRPLCGSPPRRARPLRRGQRPRRPRRSRRPWGRRQETNEVLKSPDEVAHKAAEDFVKEEILRVQDGERGEVEEEMASD